MLKLPKRVIASEYRSLNPPPLTLTLGDHRAQSDWDQQWEAVWADLLAKFSQADVGLKDGPCYTPAVFSGLQRTKNTATQIGVLVLDSDTGQDFWPVLGRLRELMWKGFIHTTYNHLTDATVIAAAPYEEWCKTHPEGTIEEYLISKKGLVPEVARG
ncbi:hypothetical protein, partial [Teichococcus vastitatis]|uniref:hypothetical protein n=1 Tax=Teichococcus vastitatis TaxID=2307076 RepID=UPI00192E4D45